MQEEIFANQAILLSEEIFAIYDFNLLDDFCNLNLQQAMPSYAGYNLNRTDMIYSKIDYVVIELEYMT